MYGDWTHSSEGVLTLDGKRTLGVSEPAISDERRFGTLCASIGA